MNNEFTEIAGEIDRIAGSVGFNGHTLLDNTNTITIRFGTGTDDWIGVDGQDMTTTGLGIDLEDISTTAGAQTALTDLTVAMTTATSARAGFGAKMNRLQNTVDLLGIQAENLQTAESRISDVDVATEMATLTRTQVLAQAGTAMLAQANTIPQMALTLLR
jgi:flagellin